MHHFISAGFDDANAAPAFAYGALISEELQRVVEDFCSDDCTMQGFAGGFVEAVGLQDIA